MTRTLATTLAALLLCGVTATACGDGDEGDGDSAAERAREENFHAAASRAADQTVCTDAATPAATPYADFPSQWTFPDDTVVYSVEDRRETGVIVTAVSSTPFADILDHLNGADQEAGFKVTSGETEENDAEANWAGNGYTGRWAIRKSATCDGETVIQVLATPS